MKGNLLDFQLQRVGWRKTAVLLIMFRETSGIYAAEIAH